MSCVQAGLPLCQIRLVLHASGPHAENSTPSHLRIKPHLCTKPHLRVASAEREQSCV